MSAEAHVLPAGFGAGATSGHAHAAALTEEPIDHGVAKSDRTGTGFAKRIVRVAPEATAALIADRPH